MATTPVTKDVLAALDACGIRYEVVDGGRDSTTLRFDVDALDLLGERVARDDTPDQCLDCERKEGLIEELQTGIADARDEASEMQTKRDKALAELAAAKEWIAETVLKGGAA